MKHTPLVEKLIQSFTCLPGVGPRSAQRMAYALLERGRDDGRGLAAALSAAMDGVKQCRRCRNYAEQEFLAALNYGTARRAACDGSAVAVGAYPCALDRTNQWFESVATRLPMLLQKHDARFPFLDRPIRVLEVGALCGSSTRWLLAALKANGDGGTLTTFDLSSSAQRFVPAELHDHWMFRQQDVLAYIATPEGDALATSVDLVFMDAVHRNEFSARYTRLLFAKFTKPVPTFCHDIYNPLMMPPFRQCQKGLVLDVLDAELECIRGVISRESSHRGGHDYIYSPAQTSGEGAELTNWIARTGRAAGLVTFSPYAARDLALPLMETFERHSLHIDQINNPGCFFTVLPRNTSINK